MTIAEENADSVRFIAEDDHVGMPVAIQISDRDLALSPGKVPGWRECTIAFSEHHKDLWGAGIVEVSADQVGDAVAIEIAGGPEKAGLVARLEVPGRGKTGAALTQQDCH